MSNREQQIRELRTDVDILTRRIQTLSARVALLEQGKTPAAELPPLEEPLRRAEPEMQLAYGCCGQPTVYLFPEKTDKRREKLVRLLRKQGVKRIYTACPNCTLQLREIPGFEIIPVWPVLAAHIRPEDITSPHGSYIWHDPCPTRNDPAQQEAVRKLLELTGADVCQPTHTGSNTLCCGNFRMLHITNPEASAAMRQKRLTELPEDRIIASSCDGCLAAFRSEGRQTQHLLELLLGKSQQRSWGNRIRTTVSSDAK